MGNADKDLLAFVLRHGEAASQFLTEHAASLSVRADGTSDPSLRGVLREQARQAGDAARDLAWLYRVNRPDWSHEAHSADCMADDAERSRAGMTAATVGANHRLHMGHVERVGAALRAQR